MNRSLEQLWRKRSRSHDSGFTGENTPVTSPGAMTWRYVLKNRIIRKYVFNICHIVLYYFEYVSRVCMLVDLC